MFRYLSETYPNRTCSVHSSVKSTSTRRKYGFGTEQVYPWYGTDKYFFVVLRNPIPRAELLLSDLILQKTIQPDNRTDDAMQD